MNLIIDSHAHVIAGDQQRYPRLAEPAAQNLPASDAPSLLQAMEAACVGRALLVQRGTIYGADNAYVCDAAAADPAHFSAICGIDAAQLSCGDTARRWHARGAIGFRLMARRQGAGLTWLSGTTARQAWAIAAECDVPMCVHLFAWNREAGVAALVDILAEYPEIRILVDHLSNGPFERAEDCIDQTLLALADHGNVFLKFTTIPLGRLQRDGIDATDVLARFVSVFGTDRLMWGSDITQSPGTYAQMVALGRAAVERLPPAQQGLLLEANCRRFYRLGGDFR